MLVERTSAVSISKKWNNLSIFFKYHKKTQNEIEQ